MKPYLIYLIVTLLAVVIFTILAARRNMHQQFKRHHRITDRKGHYYGALFVAVLLAITVWVVILCINIIAE